MAIRKPLHPEMKAALFLMIALAIHAPCVASGEDRSGRFVPVPKIDPVYPVLDAYRTAKFKRDKESKNYFTGIGEWQFDLLPAFAILFPNLRFVHLGWTYTQNPKGQIIEGLPAGLLELTVAIDKDSNRIVAGAKGTQFEEFGNLLTSNHVQIRNEAEAQRVWEVYAALNHVVIGEDPVPKWPSTKVSETEWHLGDSTWRDSHHYVQVILDANQSVLPVKRYNEKVRQSSRP